MLIFASTPIHLVILDSFLNAHWLISIEIEMSNQIWAHQMHSKCQLKHFCQCKFESDPNWSAHFHTVLHWILLKTNDEKESERERQPTSKNEHNEARDEATAIYISVAQNITFFAYYFYKHFLQWTKPYDTAFFGWLAAHLKINNKEITR